MLFKYTGQMPDQVSFDDSDIYFNPDSEVELPDELVEFPYIARMVQTGLLKAVSRPHEIEPESPEAEPEPETPAPEAQPEVAAPGAGTGSKTAPAPVQLKEDVK